MHFAIEKIMVEVDAGLAALAVDVEPHRQLLHVGNLVLGHQPRADRAEGVVRLALGPLAARSIWKLRSETSLQTQ